MKTLFKRQPQPNETRQRKRNKTETVSIVMESRRGSKTSALEGLAEEQPGTFKYITHNSKLPYCPRNSIPWIALEISYEVLTNVDGEVNG